MENMDDGCSDADVRWQVKRPVEPVDYMPEEGGGKLTFSFISVSEVMHFGKI